MLRTPAVAASVVASSAGVPGSGVASAVSSDTATGLASSAAGDPSICGVGVPGGSSGASHSTGVGLASWARTGAPWTSPPISNATAAQLASSNRASAGQLDSPCPLRDLDIVVVPPSDWSNYRSMVMTAAECTPLEPLVKGVHARKNRSVFTRRRCMRPGCDDDRGHVVTSEDRVGVVPAAYILPRNRDGT